MSVIFDALQKTQQSRESRDNTLIKRILWLNVVFLVLVVFIILLTRYHHHQTSKVAVAQPMQSATAPALPTPQHLMALTPLESKATVNTEAYKSKHTLNGVYLSDSENVALINNTFFHIGDEVDGLKIMSIETDQIKLRNIDNSLLIMRIGETA